MRCFLQMILMGSEGVYLGFSLILALDLLVFGVVPCFGGFRFEGSYYASVQ